MIIKGYNFAVTINGKAVGFKSVKTNGDTLELVKHVNLMDELPDDLPGEGLIRVVPNRQKFAYDGKFTGYGISRHHDDENLMRIVLTGVQFSGNPVFDLDATKS